MAEKKTAKKSAKSEPEKLTLNDLNKILAANMKRLSEEKEADKK